MGLESFKVIVGSRDDADGNTLQRVAKNLGARLRNGSKYILEFNDAVIDAWVREPEIIFQYALCNPVIAAEHLADLVVGLSQELDGWVIVLGDPASQPNQRRRYEPGDADAIRTAILFVAQERRAQWVSQFGSKTEMMDCRSAVHHFFELIG